MRYSTKSTVFFTFFFYINAKPFLITIWCSYRFSYYALFEDRIHDEMKPRVHTCDLRSHWLKYCDQTSKKEKKICICKLHTQLSRQFSSYFILSWNARIRVVSRDTNLNDTVTRDPIYHIVRTVNSEHFFLLRVYAV